MGVCLHHWTGPTCNVCPDRFAGSDCDRCALGYWGDDCHDVRDDLPWWGKFAIAAAVLVVVAAVVLVIMACRRWRKKRAASRSSYMLNTMGSFPDSSDGDEFFDDNINDASPGLLSDQFNLHLSDEDDDF